MNMKFYRKLPIPKEIKEQFPITPEIAAMREASITEQQKILSGESDKFMLVIGPCSADNEDSVLDYIYRLRGVQEKVKDKILIIPRIRRVTATRVCFISPTPMRHLIFLRALFR